MVKKRFRFKRKNFKSIFILLLLIWALVLGAVYFMFTQKETKYVTLVEDVNNSCTVTNNGIISSAATRKPVYIQVPSDQVDAYLKTAAQEHRCVEKTQDRIKITGDAPTEGRKVNSYVECEKANGVLLTKPIPNKCYYDEVVYWQVLKPSHEGLNPPQYLKTYYDCIRFGGDWGSDSSCRSWNGKVYYYQGPRLTNYEECTAQPIPSAGISSPCVAPHGERFTDPMLKSKQ